MEESVFLCKLYRDMALNTLVSGQNGHPFARRQFQMHFRQWNMSISLKLSLKFVPKGPIDNKPSLISRMSWRRKGDKPLYQTMMAQFTDAYMLHWTSKSEHIGLSKQNHYSPKFFVVWVQLMACCRIVDDSFWHLFKNWNNGWEKVRCSFKYFDLWNSFRNVYCFCWLLLPSIITSEWLTDWGRVTHICVSKLTIIGSDNGLSPGRRQAIIWTNTGILLIWPLGTNAGEILIEIHIFSFKKIHLEMSSAMSAILSRPHLTFRLPVAHWPRKAMTCIPQTHDEFMTWAHFPHPSVTKGFISQR